MTLPTITVKYYSVTSALACCASLAVCTSLSKLNTHLYSNWTFIFYVVVYCCGDFYVIFLCFLCSFYVLFLIESSSICIWWSTQVVWLVLIVFFNVFFDVCFDVVLFIWIDCLFLRVLHVIVNLSINEKACWLGLVWLGWVGLCASLVYVVFWFDLHPCKLIIVHIVCCSVSRQLPWALAITLTGR